MHKIIQLLMGIFRQIDIGDNSVKEAESTSKSFDGNCDDNNKLPAIYQDVFFKVVLSVIVVLECQRPSRGDYMFFQFFH